YRPEYWDAPLPARFFDNLSNAQEALQPCYAFPTYREPWPFAWHCAVWHDDWLQEPASDFPTLPREYPLPPHIFLSCRLTILTQTCIRECEGVWETGIVSVL